MTGRAGGGSYADAFRPNHTNATGGSTGGQPDADEPADEPAPPVKHHDEKAKG